MSIEVHVRVRPGVENSVWATAETVIHNTVNPKSRFVFSKVHPTTCTNTSLFRGVEPLVHRAFEGSHVTVMAYGQTGSGKTHSMLGTPHDEGIVPRAVKLLLSQVVQGRDSITLSVTEIYNDSVRDLLDPACKELQVKDGVGDMVTTDATVVEIRTLSDFTEISAQALGNRKTGVTNMNEHSSRSHMILTLEVRRGNRTVSTMSLVDLAGSESASRANTKGMQLLEGGHINQSLLSLGNVVNAIVEGRSHVPFRESKLTRLLRHSLGGHGLTCIVCCVNPARDNQDQTNASLQFAQRAMKIKTDPVVVVTMPPLFMHQFAEGGAALRADIPELCSLAYQRGLHDAFHSALDTTGSILNNHTSHTSLALHALNNCQRLLLANAQASGVDAIDALEQEYVRLKDAVSSLQTSRCAETKRAREHEVALEARRAKVSRLEKEFDVRAQEVDCEIAHWEYEYAQSLKCAVSELDVLFAEESATRAMIGQEEATDCHATASTMMGIIDGLLGAEFEPTDETAAETNCSVHHVRSLCNVPPGAADEVCLKLITESNAALDREIEDLEAAYAMVAGELQPIGDATSHLTEEEMKHKIKNLEVEEVELKAQIAATSRESSRMRVHDTVSSARRVLHVPANDGLSYSSHVTPTRRAVDESHILQTPPQQSSLPPRPSTAQNYVSPYSQRAIAAGRSPATTPKAASSPRNRLPQRNAQQRNGAANIRMEVRSAIEILRAEREKLLIKSPVQDVPPSSPLASKSMSTANASFLAPAHKPPVPPPPAEHDEAEALGIAARRRIENHPHHAGAYYLSLSPQLDIKMHESKPATSGRPRSRTQT